MGDKWEQLPFEKVFNGNIRHGIYKPRNSYNEDEGTRVLKMGIQYSDDRIGSQKMPRTKLSEEEIKRYRVYEGDLLFSRTSMMSEGAGKCSLAVLHSDPFVFDGNILCVSLDNAVADPSFYFYFFQSYAGKQRVSEIIGGTQSRSLAGSNLARVIVPLPPLPQQRAIAHILGTLDEKIELNRRMNATLEAMARAIFKSWFVDFDPVRANLDGRNTGLPPHIAGLFPDSFEDSELGKIPKGWRVGHISDIANVTIGGDWGKEEKFDGAISVRCLRGVDLEHLRSGGDANPPIRWIKSSSLEKRKLNDNNVVIAISGAGPLGRPIWVNSKLLGLFEHPLIYSNFTKRLQTTTIEHAIFLDRLLYEMRLSNEIWEYATGTAVPNLDMDGLIYGRKVLIPPDSILDLFRLIILPIYSRLYNQENRTLAEIRDALLPRLMRGEIRVWENTSYKTRGV